MSTSAPTRTQIHQAIEQLPADRLAKLWEYVLRLAQEPVAPLYSVHEQAIATGVTDLADQHDRYLYGQDKHDV